MNKFFYYDIFKILVSSKFTNMWGILKDKVINVYIWAICSVLISGYVMQSFGLSNDFGPFQLGGIIASIGLFDLYANVTTMVADFEGNKTINYYLTLPTTTFTVLCSYICYYAIVSIGITLSLIPLGKILLWNKFDVWAVAWPKLLLFIVLLNILCSTSTLLIAAIIPSLDKVEVLWMRIIFPLWFLGGFQFSWMSVHSIVPMMSYAMLLNPITYMTEGIRAALFGQSAYLSFWTCCAVLIGMLGIIGVVAFRALRKRLDCVRC
jgi:ABC-type polysaccharide/polyol phosphate export permease